MVAELFDHARDQFAVEAATDQHGDIAITISVAGRKKTLMPESVNRPGCEFGGTPILDGNGILESGAEQPHQ